jgi:hypothetical protein
MLVSMATGFVQPYRCFSESAPAGEALTRAQPATPSPRPVHLGTLGNRTIAGLVAGDARDLLAEFRGFAEALADPVVGDRTRRTDLARSIAVARAQQGVLDVLLGDALSCRDLETVEVLGKQAERLAKRIDSLLTQHRAELAPKRPIVVVKAENANVLSVERASR